MKKVLSIRIVILMIVVVLIFPLLPLLVSGDWGWIEGWLLVALFIPGFFLSRIMAAKKNPDIIAERAQSFEMKEAKSWDRVLAPLVAYGILFVLLTAGVDRRFALSPPFHAVVRACGFFLILAGFIFGSWALVENKFFSGVVRIQKDRGHKVVDSGPYRFVRHPGYSGSVLMYLATPILLNSLWAFIPAVMFTIVLIIRTILEDSTLQCELDGYAQYTTRTRYRLLPGIW